MPELPKAYNPQETEERIYKLWEESGTFNPDNLPNQGGKPFTILMPPTNANGNLHAGHGLVMTIEDIMIRYKRMRGHKALWVPGLDHAGFETQVVYEKQLEKEGRSRFEMDPHRLYDEILNFTLTNSSNIKSQIRRMGASCDWSREKFTLDPDIVRTVYQTFKRLYDDDLVYRGKRIVSWCTKHQTSFSDLEIKDEERVEKLYYLKYGPFVIATARPETKFGDKYVVMHPDDQRYAQYTDGQKIELEWINGPITATVIKDVAIDMAFGTGVMTITPAHDATDFEIAERHGLEKEQVIDLRGKLLAIAGEFFSMKIGEAREKIIDKLKSKGLVDHIDENYKHVVKTCYKCGTVIEPQIKNQWFVKMKPLAEKALEKIKSGEITYIPDHYQKISVHWLENIMDWNISRQIVWGIPIPVWYCVGCSNIRISPTVKSRWYILRHGETDFNKEHRIQGASNDLSLNDDGREQARFTATRLKEAKIDLILTSDFKRAHETASIIGETTGAEIITDARLRERTVGKTEGMIFEDAKREFPDLLTYDGKAAGQESFAEVEQRVWESFSEHAKNHLHKNVVIVSHAATMRAFLKKIKNINPEEFNEKILLPPHAQPIQLDVLDPCENCGSHFFEKDSDTFDTWFSSGQWPFAALGYQDGKDFKTFYPTDVLETAGDIIFFWVTRMIILGLYVTGELPFKTVYLHGMVLDAKGQKMSKSKGNVINPLDLADKFGTDAFRMGLVAGNTPGTSLALAEDKIKGYKHFANKVWNIARYVLEKRDPMSTAPLIDQHIDEFNALAKEVTEDMDSYRFYLASEKIYHYIWHTLADKIIEESKTDITAFTPTLDYLLKNSLKLLHPFMPFVTEELWGQLLSWDGKKLLILEAWPTE